MKIKSFFSMPKKHFIKENMVFFFACLTFVLTNGFLLLSYFTQFNESISLEMLQLYAGIFTAICFLMSLSDLFNMNSFFSSYRVWLQIKFCKKISKSTLVRIFAFFLCFIMIVFFPIH